jgi:hypothetical protein
MQVFPVVVKFWGSRGEVLFCVHVDSVINFADGSSSKYMGKGRDDENGSRM